MSSASSIPTDSSPKGKTRGRVMSPHDRATPRPVVDDPRLNRHEVLGTFGAASESSADGRRGIGCCPGCGRSAGRFYRVKGLAWTSWAIGCAMCVARAMEREDGVVYGGSACPGSLSRSLQRRKRRASRSDRSDRAA